MDEPRVGWQYFNDGTRELFLCATTTKWRILVAFKVGGIPWTVRIAWLPSRLAEFRGPFASFAEFRGPVRINFDSGFVASLCSANKPHGTRANQSARLRRVCLATVRAEKDRPKMAIVTRNNTLKSLRVGYSALVWRLRNRCWIPHTFDNVWFRVSRST
jgi:hypothetical protein